MLRPQAAMGFKYMIMQQDGMTLRSLVLLRRDLRIISAHRNTIVIENAKRTCLNDDYESERHHDRYGIEKAA